MRASKAIMQQGCLRPLLVSAGVLLALALTLVLIYRDTFSLMFANMSALREGAAEARALRTPEDLLDYLAVHPEHVSLVAYDVARPEAGLFYQADAARAVAGVPRLLVLAEYVRQASEGLLDPGGSLPPGALERFALPGAGRGAPAPASPPPQAARALGIMTLENVVEAMMLRNDHAAADLLVTRLGRSSLESLPGRLHLPRLGPPLPEVGLFLSWSNHTLSGPPEARLADYEARTPAAYAALVYALTDAYLKEPAFREQERARRTERGSDLSLRQQRAFAQVTFPRGTAAAYAAFLEKALTGMLLSAEVSRAVVGHLERPLPDTAATAFHAVGSEAGSFPGIVSFAGYARGGPSGPRVVVLLMEGVPIGVFYHLMQTGLDQGFEVQLLGDDAFFERARTRLQ